MSTKCCWSFLVLYLLMPHYETSKVHRVIADASGWGSKAIGGYGSPPGSYYEGGGGAWKFGQGGGGWQLGGGSNSWIHQAVTAGDWYHGGRRGGQDQQPTERSKFGGRSGGGGGRNGIGSGRVTGGVGWW